MGETHKINETDHVVPVCQILCCFLCFDWTHCREGGVERLQPLVVLLPHVVTPRLVLRLLLLGQLLVLVAADLGHVWHGEVRVLLLDVFPPLAVVEHVHRKRLLGHLGMAIVVLRSRIIKLL